ncbi:MAG: hypothetical protein ACNYPG_01890 [Candidatus Porifericomitaceae bacterium WSBS_2022_MAG_OTU9]
MKVIVLILAGLLLLSCSPRYSCGVPSGSTCLSLAQVYQRVVGSTRQQGQKEMGALPRPVAAPPGQAKIWIAPWNDALGNSYSELVLHFGTAEDDDGR